MSSSTKSLDQRVAIVTGAARGIGLAAVARLAQAGASIVAFDLPDTALADAQATADSQGVGFLSYAGDVSKSQAWQEVCDETMAKFGRIDILVNNAGISGRIGSMLDYPDEVFDQVMAVNARSVFLGMKHVANHMKDKGGSIVNISSVSGIGGGRFTIAYTASKHAVVGMTKLASTELAPLKIRVNALCPSPTATEMMFKLERSRAPNDPESVRKAMTAMTPMGRYGEPEEIAEAIYFLASDASSFISGAALPIDGGLKAA